MDHLILGLSCIRLVLGKLPNPLMFIIFVIFLSCLQVDASLHVSFVGDAHAHDFGGGDDDDDDDDDDEKDDQGGDANNDNASADECDDSNGAGSDGSEGGPVSLLKGAEKFYRIDMVVNGQFPIELKRNYNSRSTYDSALGYGWTFKYDRRLYEYADNSVVIRYGCGRKDRYVFTGGAYQPTSVRRMRGELTALAGGEFVFTHRKGIKDFYDTQGRLIAKENIQGDRLEFSYDTRGKLPLIGSSPYSIDPAQPMVVSNIYRLTRIEERGADGVLTGNYLDFVYDENTGRISTVTANDGRQVSYQHDVVTPTSTLGNLVQVNGLEGFVSSYIYDDRNASSVIQDIHNVTTIREGSNGIPYVNSYDALDRVIVQQNGATQRSITYVVDGLETQVDETITDSAGLNPVTYSKYYWFDLSTQKVSRFEDGEGNWFEYDYDAQAYKDLTRIYYNQGSKQAPVRVLQKTIDYSYDSEGNKIQEQVALDSGEIVTKSWTYDHGQTSSEQTVSSLDPTKLFRTEYTYYHDGNGIPTNLHELRKRRDDGSYQVITFSYDSKNRRQTVTYADGHVQVFEYTLGKPFATRIYHQDGGLESPYRAIRFDYDAQGNISNIWDGNNNHTYREYDDKGRVTLIRNDANEETHFVYSTDRLTQKETGRTIADGEGQLIRYNYNTNNRLASIERKADDATWSTISSYTYYSDNHLYTKTDGAGNTWTYTYDSRRRLKTIMDPQSHITTLKYDAVGNLISVLDANLNEILYTYDDLDRLTQIDYAGVSPGVVNTYGYDAKGNLISIEDGETNTSQFSYDALSRRTAETRQLGQTIQYFYDDRDRPDYLLNARNQKIDYTYEPWGGIDRIDFYANPVTTTIDRTIDYSYDFNGNMTSVADTDSPVSPILSHTYDGLNRPDVTTVHYIPGGDIVVDENYDRYGNRDGIILTDSSGSVSHQYNYNKLNRLTTASLPGGASLGFSYYDNDQLQQMQYPNSLVTDYVYEPAGPVNDIHIHAGATTLEQLAYTFDNQFNVDTITDSHGLHNYDYDGLDRLTDVNHPSGLGIPVTEAFAYDNAGNRENPLNLADYDYDANNRITASPGVGSYSHDDDGNILSKSTGVSFNYNHLSRLTGFNDTGTGASYVYDHQGRRIKKTVNGQTGWYLWDGERLLAEYDNSGQRQKRYAYLPDHYAPTQVEDANGIYLVHTDHLDAPRLLTDSSNTVVWRADYAAYGQVAIQDDPDGNGNAIEFNVRYPGQYQDQESGLYYNRFRYYDPSTGRYISRDPLGELPGLTPTPDLSREISDYYQSFSMEQIVAFGLNHPFGYVENNPLRFTDPLGLNPGMGGGTSSCAHYDMRCSQSGGTSTYYCSIAPLACNYTPPSDWTRCVRKCLQDFDKACSRECDGGPNVECTVEAHAHCWIECGKL